MKIPFALSWALLALSSFSCKDPAIAAGGQYVFVKPFCAMVTVGGVVGIAKKCFAAGDTVVAEHITKQNVVIRIAKHSAYNEGESSNVSYQELLNIPFEFVELAK